MRVERITEGVIWSAVGFTVTVWALTLLLENESDSGVQQATNEQETPDRVIYKGESYTEWISSDTTRDVEQ